MKKTDISYLRSQIRVFKTVADADRNELVRKNSPKVQFSKMLSFLLLATAHASGVKLVNFMDLTHVLFKRKHLSRVW